MVQPFHFRFENQNLWLSTQRCIYWEEEQILILSDPHFGKTGHFRKSGIGVPQHVYQEDLHRLLHVIQHFGPGTVLITGDLFHSTNNKEIDLFIRWRQNLPNVKFTLIKGNHDILPPRKYKDAQIEVTDELTLSPFCFTHDIDNCKADDAYVISGHIHPGIKISGTARQSMRLPCFYFGEKYAVLPAFSLFTGLASIRPKVKDQIFAITENMVMPVK